MNIITKKNDQFVSRTISLWQKPYAVFKHKTTKWVFALSITCFMFFFMFSIEVYGMDVFPKLERLIWSGVFAVSNMAVMLIHFFGLQKVLEKSFFKKYTFGKTFLWILWISLCVAFTNFLIEVWIGMSDFVFSNYLYDLVNILPLSFVASVMAILTHDRFFLEKKITDIEIVYVHVSKDDDKLILFKSEDKNRENDFEILFSRVLYAKSDGNYVDVYYRHDNKTKYKSIRTNLKKLEEESLHPDFVRSHKSYMVNKRNISSIKSTVIWLNDNTTKIPLSETYRKNFK